MKNKRGQVTLFVILGILVLLIIGIAIFILSQNKKTPTEPYEEDYDAKLSPIYNDVVFCTKTLGKEAIIKIGETGGYTEINPADYTYNSFNAYENDALELFPQSGVIIPYWTYIDDAPSCKTCNFVQNYPSLNGQGNSIQNSLETYIEKNLVSCLDNFSAYKFDFDISYEKAPKCTVEIRDESVFFMVDWKLNVKFPDNTIASVSLYTTNIDVRLKEMYKYAVSLLFQTEMIEDSRAFEYFTKDIISFLSLGGEDATIPPVSGPTVFEFNAPTLWLQRNVQEILKNAVSETIPFMQVVGTKDSLVYYTNNSIENNFYANFQNVVYYDNEFASEIRVRFNYYPIWPFYVDVSPSEGQVIMPESSTMNLILMKLSTTKYRFYYNVAYPVLVTLEDDSAFNGEGYYFNFPFEVNLRDNNPYSNETIDMTDYLTQPEEEETDLGYSQRTVPINISVIDGYTKLPVEDVTISYSCVDKVYIVGTSKISSTNPNAMIESYLAPCIGGLLSVSTTGYGESPIHRDIILDEPVELLYEVYPSKNIELELRRRIFTPTIFNIDITASDIDRGWGLSSGDEVSTSTLEDDEEVIVMMSEIRSDGSTGNIVYLNSKDEERTISLVPGEYSIEIISIWAREEN